MRKTLEDGGQIETSDLLKSNRLLKTQNMQKDKQIEDLVKAANKLQESVDGFEQENVALKYLRIKHLHFLVCLNCVILIGKN